MDCPHKNSQSPPCDVAQHPYKQDVYFCKVCQESYSIRDIGNDQSINSMIVVAGIILVIFGVAIMSADESLPPAPSQPNPVSQSAK
jgi:hypothetical protein